MKFTEKVKLDKNDAIMLCHAKRDDGLLFWVYLLADKRNVEKLRHDFKKAVPCDYSKYGKIISYGEGENPSSADIEKVRSEYPKAEFTE